VFGSMVDDSLGASGTLEPGRRSFRWTVMPRSLGSVSLEPPAFSWFDPRANAYRTAGLPPIVLDVEPGSASGAARATSSYPAVFGGSVLDPFERRSRPWLAALRGAGGEERWTWLRPAGASLAAAAAVACAVLAMPHSGDPRGVARARQAERLARSGDVVGAEREWRELWRSGARSPGLAARLGWARLGDEDVAAASLWVLRG